MLRKPLERRGHKDKQEATWWAFSVVHSHAVNAEDDQKDKHLGHLTNQRQAVWCPAVRIDPWFQPREGVVTEPLLERGFAGLVLVLAEVVQLFLGQKCVAEGRT